jgi:hypothetical protein
MNARKSLIVQRIEATGNWCCAGCALRGLRVPGFTPTSGASARYNVRCVIHGTCVFVTSALSLSQGLSTNNLSGDHK